MTVPSWFWPPPAGAQARGISLAPYGAGMAVVDWTRPVLWPFVNNAFSAALTLGSGSYGFSSAAPDSAGGLFDTTWDGVLWHITSGGLVTSGQMPSGQAYVGTAFAAGSGFAVAASGHVYTSAGSSLGSFPLPVRSVVSSGSTIAALMAGSGIGTMNANNGATGFIALPTGNPTLACAAIASGKPLAVAGWSNAAPLSGATASAMDPQDSTVMLAVGSGRALVWGAPGAFADAWSQTQSLTGLAALNSVAWRPDGTQALATSVVAGEVQVLGFTTEVLSLAQTLAVASACGAAVAGDSIHAIVAQSGMAQATSLSFAGSTWSAGAAVTGLAGIVAIAPYGASGAIAACSGSLDILGLQAGVWSIATTVALPFIPTALTVDTYGQAYAAGGGSVALVSGSTLVASGTWSGGSATSIAVQQGRIVIAVPGDNLLRVFGLSAPGVLSQQSTSPLSLGTKVGLGLSETTLFAMGSGGTPTYGFSGAPYALTPVLSGMCAFWNGSAWTATGMGVGHVPSAISLEASGGAWLATRQNTLWHIASGGTVLSSGTLQQFPGQPQTTPACASSILVSGSSVFVATSIPGFLTQVA